MELERHQWAKERHALDMSIAASKLALVNQGQGGGTGRGGMPQNTSTGTIEVKPYDIAVGANPSSSTIGPGQPGSEIRQVGGGITLMPAQGLNMDDFSSPGYSSWMLPNKVEPFFEKNPAAKPPPEAWKKIWPNAVDITHHFGIWYPKYAGDDFPPYTGLRNEKDKSPVGSFGRFLSKPLINR